MPHEDVFNRLIFYEILLDILSMNTRFLLLAMHRIFGPIWMP